MTRHDDEHGRKAARRPVHASREELDDAYHEYLWGTASPRAFARKTRIAGAKTRNSTQVMNVEVDADVDLSGAVPR